MWYVSSLSFRVLMSLILCKKLIIFSLEKDPTRRIRAKCELGSYVIAGHEHLEHFQSLVGDFKRGGPWQIRSSNPLYPFIRDEKLLIRLGSARGDLLVEGNSLQALAQLACSPLKPDLYSDNMCSDSWSAAVSYLNIYFPIIIISYWGCMLGNNVVFRCVPD